MDRGREVVLKLATIVYFFVMGTFLIAVPWSTLWPQTFPQAPWLSVLFSNPTLRGAISGFGLVLIAGAIFEIHHVISHKK